MFRLPAEAEWEAVARGTMARDYPWGEYEPGRANTYEAHLRRTSPVGVYPSGATPGAEPVYDLAGNCWEWIGSLFREYPIEPGDGRDDQEAEGARVLRGGAWYNRSSYALAACRVNSYPDFRSYLIGFRVLCSPPSSATGH